MVPSKRPEDTIESRLAEIGLRPSDVHCLINTHLHFDHCGGNCAFPSTPILVQRSHYEHARESPTCPSRYFDLPDLTYELIDGEPELFGGVRAFLTPGHAPGRPRSTREQDLRRPGSSRRPTPRAAIRQQPARTPAPADGPS
jgi:N-acyl homoserine lactone hydrolase